MGLFVLGNIQANSGALSDNLFTLGVARDYGHDLAGCACPQELLLLCRSWFSLICRKRVTITLVSIKYPKCDLCPFLSLWWGRIEGSSERHCLWESPASSSVHQQELLLTSRCSNWAVRKGWVALVLWLFIFSSFWGRKQGQKQVENSWAELAQGKLPRR